MLISVASEYIKKFRSIGANINDINSKVSSLSKTISTNSDGLGDSSVGTNALSPNSVDNNSISAQSITADKLDISSVSSHNSNQRVPAPLNSIDYWTPVLLENSALHTEPYFKDVKIRNISVDTNGLTFSPERATPVAITYAGLENGVATLTTNIAHGYEVGDTVHISNLPSPFAGEWAVSEVPSTTTLCYQLSKFSESPINYKIGEEIAGTVSLDNDIKMVVSHSCINGVASLSLQNMFSFTSTTNQDDTSFDGHGYDVGYIIDIRGLGSPYDGTHIITEVPSDQPSILRYNIADKQISNFSTAIPLTSALGDGSSITYRYSNDVNSNATATLDFYNNEPVTITGFTDTGYNITGAIDIVGSNSFTVPGTYDTLNTPATAGLPQVIVAHVKVDAEARLFLTGKTKVPDSRSISVSWVTDGNPINMYFVSWLTNQTGTTTEPRLTAIDETQNVSISKLQGVNNYYWEVPVDVEHYALLAEVLPGWNPVLLKEAYVFEGIGDQDQKTEHITRISITNNIATIYTATPHPYYTGDVVQMFGLESANSGLIGVPYEVDTVSEDSTSFTVNTVGLSNTSDYVAVSGTVIGGYQKDHISSLSPSGLAIDASLGQSINLTDEPTDNYITITTSTADTVASISNTGAGTFKTLDADSLSVDGDITIGNENIPLVGTFIDEKFNGNSYSGSLLDRLARGTIYQAVWLSPTGNIPANAQYYGLAAGTFKLDSNRLYQIYVSSSGMRANPTASVAFEILLSTTPIRVDDSGDLTHMGRTLAVPIYGIDSTALSNTGTTNVNAATTSLYVNNGFWGDLQGHFYSISPTPVATNTTIFTITNWQRYSNGNVLITVDNNVSTPTKTSNAGKYIQSTINANSHMYIGVNISNTTYSPYINGTYEVTKQSRNTFLIDTTNTTAVSLQNGTSLGTITLVDPIMTNTKATFSRAYQTGITGTASAGSTTINGISSTANIFAGDTIYRTSGASLANTTVVSITNSTAIVVANSAGSSGSITFDTNRTVATSDGTNHTYILENLFQSGQLVDVDSSNASWDITGGTIVSANATQFTITPTGTPQANGNTNTAVTTATWSDRQIQLHRNYLPSETDLYYVLRFRHGVATFNTYAITISENPNSMLAVTDLGQAKQMTFVAQQGDSASPWTSGLPIGYTNTAANTSSSSTNTAVVTETQTVYASDSAYYDNYGKGTGTSIPYAYKYYLYQGNPGTASGVKKSAVLFPLFDFTNKTSGLTITKLEVYLRNRHSYNSNGLTAYLAAHEATSLGTSIPAATNTCPAITTTFTKGQGKWVALPSSWYTNFDDNGTCRGILLGVTDENPDTYYDGITNYGYFDGINLDDAPQLRITYKYNASVGSNNSSGGGGGGGGYGAQVAL
jgi:hypothetical protein